MRGQGGIRVGDNVLFGPGAQLLAVNHVCTDSDRPVMDQGITAEGLVDEGDGAGLEAPLPILLVPMSSENDGRNANVRGREMPEEVEAAHSGHPQIEHEATGSPALGGGQELFPRAERLDSEAHRPQEILERATQRSVIVHDGDHWRIVRAHALSRIHRLLG